MSTRFVLVTTIWSYRGLPDFLMARDSVVITALLVILVGTFAIAISSFATANQHKYGYRG